MTITNRGIHNYLHGKQNRISFYNNMIYIKFYGIVVLLNLQYFCWPLEGCRNNCEHDIDIFSIFKSIRQTLFSLHIGIQEK